MFGLVRIVNYSGLISGLISLGLGGAIFVYILSRVIMNAGYQQSVTIYELQQLLFESAMGGFIALLLLGLGLWLIIKDAKAETKQNA